MIANKLCWKMLGHHYNNLAPFRHNFHYHTYSYYSYQLFACSQPNLTKSFLHFWSKLFCFISIAATFLQTGSSNEIVNACVCMRERERVREREKEREKRCQSFAEKCQTKRKKENEVAYFCSTYRNEFSFFAFK